jgi:lipoprotein-anchoring transpeptidase ErfK/SrfK
VSSASSSRRRSRASLVACLSLALLSYGGAARAEAGSESVPAAGHLEWAQAVVRAKPGRGAAHVAVLTQFRPDFRPRTVLALGVRRDRSGRPAWYRISLPGRPNGRTGWVPAGSVKLKPIHTEIVIDRSERTLELRDAGRVVLRTRVAVGATGMETPLGRFYVVAKFRPTAPVLGAYAFETSAYSKLSEWPGGGIVGIHGTNAPWLLGQAVSHGCIRVANQAILRLRPLTPVGTPIRIVA